MSAYGDLNNTEPSSDINLILDASKAAEEDEDMLGVIEALLQAHHQDTQVHTKQAYTQDQAVIERAISLNEKLQHQVTLQIAFIDKQLELNKKLMREAKLTSMAENRFGERLFLHKPYEKEVNYFDSSELLLSEQELKRVVIEEEEQDEEGSDVEISESVDVMDENKADDERKFPKKSWSLKEREKLVAGIITEAKRAIAIGHIQKNEGWRVWEIEKVGKKELENFPVYRLDWDRISDIHVQTRTANQCLMQWTTQEHPIINKKPWGKEESARLTELVNEIGHRQWERVANELGTGRTIAQCFCRYMADENMKFAKSLKWTKEEDEQLTHAVQLFGDCNWQHIASTLKGRTGQQCLQRWTKSINPNINKDRWTTEESEKLKRAVEFYGVGNWSKVQRLVPGRTDMQCRERYVNILQPTVKRTKLTDEEVEQIIAIVRRVGPKWSYIAEYFPGRTDHQVYRAYHDYLQKTDREEKRKKKNKQKEFSKQEKKSKRKRKSKSNSEEVFKRPKVKEGIPPPRTSSRPRRACTKEILIEDDADTGGSSSCYEEEVEEEEEDEEEEDQ